MVYQLESLLIPYSFVWCCQYVVWWMFYFLWWLERGLFLELDLDLNSAGVVAWVERSCDVLMESGEGLNI